MKVNYLDEFSGIGGFARGLLKAGFEFEWHGFCEIDPHASKLYMLQFPDAVELGDIRLYRISKIDLPMDLLFEIYQWMVPDRETRRLTNYARFKRLIRNWRSVPARIHLVTFGFPCQDLSVAGKRKGLVGARSGLFYHSLETIRDFQPDLFIFENVKGLFSSNGGRDFVSILRAVAELGLYDCGWQLVNTAWVLPQNRERIYFIGYLGTCGRYRREVLPIREDGGKHNGESEERRGKGEWFQETDCCSTIRAKNPDSGTDTFVAVYRYQNKNAGVVIDDIVPTLKASGGTDIRKSPVVKVGTLRTHKDGEGFREMKDGVAPALNARAREDGSGQPVVAIPVLTPERAEKRQNGRRFKEPGDDMFTLTGQDRHGVAIPVSDVTKKTKNQNGRRIKEPGEEMFTLTNATQHGVMVYDLKTPSSSTRKGGVKAGETPAIDTNAYLGVNAGYRIRRLTPRECFRLQGIPDEVYHLAKANNISDTQLYKMAGNAITDNWAFIIGSRLLGAAEGAG